MPSRTSSITTRGRAKPVRKTGNTRPVAVGGIWKPSDAASVGATSCCVAGTEKTPVFTAGPANISGIETSYDQGEPCMYATFGSGRVMKSPSRGTIRSWPVRPGKYARANISRKRCRVAESGGACLTCSPETVQVIATRLSASRLAPQRGNFEMTEVRRVVMAAPFRKSSGEPRRNRTLNLQSGLLIFCSRGVAVRRMYLAGDCDEYGAVRWDFC